MVKKFSNLKFRPEPNQQVTGEETSRSPFSSLLSKLLKHTTRILMLITVVISLDIKRSAPLKEDMVGRWEN